MDTFVVLVTFNNHTYKVKQRGDISIHKECRLKLFRISEEMGSSPQNTDTSESAEKKMSTPSPQLHADLRGAYNSCSIAVGQHRPKKGNFKIDLDNNFLLLTPSRRPSHLVSAPTHLQDYQCISINSYSEVLTGKKLSELLSIFPLGRIGQVDLVTPKKWH